MVLGEIGKLIKQHPEVVIESLRDAGIKVPYNITPKGIVKLIYLNKNNKVMIQNLSLLVVTSTQFSGSGFSSFGEDSGGTATEEKGQFFQKIGDFFKSRQEAKANAVKEGGLDPKKPKAPKDPNKESFFKKLGAFFNKNKEKIGAVGGVVYESLQDRKNAEALINSNATNQNQLSGKQPMTTTTKVFIVVGIVAVIGLGYYFLTKKK
jgi:hypothetical protein